MQSATQQKNDRSAFTLIELLMVITIIAFLTSMTVVVMNGIADQAKGEATKTTVLKVNRLLEQRMEAFDRGFKGARRDQYVLGTVTLLASINGRFDYFTNHPDEAPPAIRLLARKAGFRFEFPQRIAEMNVTGTVAPAGTAGLGASVTNSATGMPNQIYRRIAFPAARNELIEGGNTTPSETDINSLVTTNWDKHIAYELAARATDLDSVHSTESSEILYFMLVKSNTLGASSGNADQFITAEISDTDQDGLPEFVDAWGHPLQFYRWPTRLFDPTAPSPFVPVFSNPTDNTEVDPTPDGIDADGNGREITPQERFYAGLLVKGLPPSPAAIGSATQRDMMLVDPDDPVGILYTFIEDETYKAMGIDLTLQYNETLFHTPDTYHTPLIVSAGADELLGLREPNNTNASLGIFGNLAQYAGTTAPGFSGPSFPASGGPVFEALLDNITNRNRRAGARR